MRPLLIGLGAPVVWWYLWDALDWFTNKIIGHPLDRYDVSQLSSLIVIVTAVLLSKDKS